MLDETDLNDNFIEKMINTYIGNKNTLKDWRYYLIKYPSMRDGKFGMYYWSNPLERNYNIIMMNTEKSMNGKNWNIFLYTLNQLPEFSGRLSLGDYAYQGDKLKILNTDYEMECLNEKYVIHFLNDQKEYEILQINGVDIEDRIMIGKKIINNILQGLAIF